MCRIIKKAELLRRGGESWNVWNNSLLKRYSRSLIIASILRERDEFNDIR